MWRTLLLLSIVSSAAPLAASAQTRGKVVAIESDSVVRVELEGGASAREGDRVRILWSVGGETLEVRTGSVVEGASGSARVRLDPGDSAVSPTMTAVIQSEGPALRTESLGNQDRQAGDSNLKGDPLAGASHFRIMRDGVSLQFPADWVEVEPRGSVKIGAQAPQSQDREISAAVFVLDAPSPEATAMSWAKSAVERLTEPGGNGKKIDLRETLHQDQPAALMVLEREWKQQEDWGNRVRIYGQVVADGGKIYAVQAQCPVSQATSWEPRLRQILASFRIE